MSTPRFVLRCLVAIACLSGCAAIGGMGSDFREIISSKTSFCKELRLGPHLDPSDPEYRQKRRATDCNFLKLEPQDWKPDAMVRADGQQYPIPKEWLSTPEGVFAHSIKLPIPNDSPKLVHRNGMSRGDYFQALCNTEAGDFAFSPGPKCRWRRADALPHSRV